KKTIPRSVANGRRTIFSGCSWGFSGWQEMRRPSLNGVGIPDITPYLSQALIAQFDGETHIDSFVSVRLQFKRRSPGFFVRELAHHQIRNAARGVFEYGFQRCISGQVFQFSPAEIHRKLTLAARRWIGLPGNRTPTRESAHYLGRILFGQMMIKTAQPITEVTLLAGIERLLGYPVSDHVVVDFRIGRNFYEFNPTFAPISLRGDPKAGAQVIKGFHI